MEGRRIRETFLRFFEEREHVRVKSASLIPPPNSGLLLTNAGMNQFVPYFLGVAEPPYRRATSVQKSFRAVDIDNVGHDARHLTLFEMLGNFSFGDYFKRESLSWGLQLVTEGYGIDPARLWATVLEGDDETVEIWRELGLPAERIVARDREENFWWMHAAGPGGPCSEIYVDRGPRYGPEGGPAVDEERYMEVWNHVFMQDEVDADGRVTGELPRKNVDTGSSVERVAMVLNELDSVFDTDLLRPMVEVGERLSGRRYGDDEAVDVSLRVVAEHGRAAAFLIADGVQPSNEGRGYVLRRMLRRLVSHARRVGIEGPVMPDLVRATAETLGEAYPELRENEAFALQVAGSEEERFSATLRQGMEMFRSAVGRTPAGGRLSGDDAFRLHDTHGFPRELTAELAADEGLDVDMERFDALMEEQRRRAKQAVRRGGQDEELSEAISSAGGTEFAGYDTLAVEAHLLAVLGGGVGVEAAEEGDEVRVLLDRTPFYAESGGQIADVGTIRTPGGLIRITDAQWAPGEVIVHTGVVESGEVRRGDQASAEVDAAGREATARAHSATHIVHWTLRHVLGDHARQAGSLVAPGRLRFDFPHHAAVPRDVLEEAEEIANRRLAADDEVRVFHASFEEARDLGAIALFGEKYGDTVRVVEIGEYSRELCGGTHVHHSGNIGLVRILHEASIGAGMRRVEAIVGPDALREINLERRLLDEIVDALGAREARSAPERARQVIEQMKRLQSELGRLRKGDREAMVGELAERASPVDGVSLVVAEVAGEDADGLRELAQSLRSRLERRGAAAAVLGNADGGKAILVAACTAPLVDRGVTAPGLLEPAAAAIGGGGGGKPILGMAGGPRGDALPDALSAIPRRLAELLAENGG